MLREGRFWSGASLFDAGPGPVGPRLGRVTPTHKMPDDGTARRRAAILEVNNALCIARCSAQLAGMETQDFVVRELLLTAIQQIDRAAAGVRRLVQAPQSDEPR